MPRTEGLELKEVTLDYLEQYNNLLRYVFQVTDRELSQIGWEVDEIIKAKQPSLAQATVLGWFDNDELISQLAIYPLQVRIFDKTYNMGGITGVGTYPEYSGQGLMYDIIYKALNIMKDKGQSISFLYPYSIPYYRKKGWEIVSDRIGFEVLDHQLPKFTQSSGKVVRVDAESKEIKDSYQRFALKTHGALVRSELAWNEYLLWEPDDIMAAVYYNDQDELDGSLLYRISDEVFYIKEIISVNETARSALWNFISAHFSMITKVKGYIYTDEPLSFLFEDADIKEYISPYYMARIVDIVQFIKEYPFKPDTTRRKWLFQLDDPLLEWNRGTFELTITKEGKGSIKRVDKPTLDIIDVQTLTTMLLSYKSPSYLKRIGRLNCSEETLEMLTDAIEQRPPYFSDYF